MAHSPSTAMPSCVSIQREKKKGKREEGKLGEGRKRGYQNERRENRHKKKLKGRAVNNRYAK